MLYFSQIEPVMGNGRKELHNCCYVKNLRNTKAISCFCICHCSFYSFSCHYHPSLDQLILLLHTFIHSVFLWSLLYKTLSVSFASYYVVFFLNLNYLLDLYYFNCMYTEIILVTGPIDFSIILPFLKLSTKNIILSFFFSYCDVISHLGKEHWKEMFIYIRWWMHFL